MINRFLILIIFLFYSCLTENFIENNETNKIFKGKSTDRIIIENISFEDNDLLRLSDNNNNLLVYYNRVENKNYLIKNIEIFDSFKQLQYILMPFYDSNKQESSIVISDRNNNEGKISCSTNIQMDMNDIKILDKITLNFFNKPYKYEITYDTGFNHSKKITQIYYNNELAIYQEYDPSSSDLLNGEIIVRKDYFEKNKLDAATLALCMSLFNEFSSVLSNDYRLNK